MWAPGTQTESQLPGIFEPTIFDGDRFRKVRDLSSARFVKTMHPKSEISPTRDAIEKVLAQDWVGQLKIHGHRAQIHISADGSEPSVAFNRHGQPHKKLIPAEIDAELRRVFAPSSDWNVIEAEWLKPEGKLFVFDFIKKEGKLLRDLNYLERWKQLPRDFISPHIQVLPVLREIGDCLNVFDSNDTHVEGLVFKATHRRGFSDTSIIRCRKK